ncbi:MAG: sodium:solute symporter family protein [Candidatus Latescibacteria bacterium]|nr:sodium:solute symporter family protein [Candidatus Latescibacterota bacterium]
MTTAVIFVYLALVLGIGLVSHRLFRGTGEDYFVASRTIGPFLLLMSLFGTNMTAFAILGASGESYHIGIGVFGLMASSSALVIPAVFFFVGTRLWALGKRHGFLTQVQYFRRRWGSDGLGLGLFIVLVALVIPYLLIGVMGGGLTMEQMTGGQIPAWVGGLLVCGVVLAYVCFGGLRGTAWANAFQTLVFMILGGVAFVTIIGQLGGLEQALDRVAQSHPELLVRGDKINSLKWLTYTCIPLSVGMFPHIFMHWLTAQSARTFRWPIVLYPLCIGLVWVPSVLLGLVGTIDFPGLEGPAANGVLVKLIDLHAPGLLAGLLAAGVFAAIMSSLDSQVLSIGNMFTQDIVRHYGFQDRMSDRQQILSGRLFVAAILAFTFVLSLVADRSIFKLAVWSFSGFAALFPIVLAALFWKRSTQYGAWASLLSVAVLWSYFFVQGWKTPGYTVGGTGLLPVAAMLAVSALAMVVGSLLSRPPDHTVLNQFFDKTRP